ncbi:PhzF family phenazine biosynthesis protein [Schumannella sp. 10F1B-5-1]|uniref:PhzF family phenazine biosynthesis protein n=1 Tax=Schumannella sp. 10F1B-5-1 TaxID=2590780 RepID=UPI0011315185|nr:PhzF family phenazine biosynthesis protein [Schumannella sp. 10F1B-5-1]TPW72908.1 PhzF family phenazine biosynthesis protein [Schumannella sp. 10F1B-5-1]
MPRSRSFAQVDVFSAEPGLGNPVAVVLDAVDLTEAEMAVFARWTNLSETTFVLPPTPEGRAAGADYRLRIFTPGGELPFAGHPTLGSAHAWLESGGAPLAGDVLRQECGAGVVPLRRTPTGLAFAAPPLRRSGPIDAAELTEIADVLGIAPDRIVDHAWVDNGPGWAALLLASAEEALAVVPDPVRIRHHMLGVVGPHPVGSLAAIEVRGFAGRVGVPEDPVTGGLNASVAQWLIAAGRLPASYRATQGAAIGRRGVIDVDADADGIWVGGPSTTVIRGTVEL